MAAWLAPYPSVRVGAGVVGSKADGVGAGVVGSKVVGLGSTWSGRCSVGVGAVRSGLLRSGHAVIDGVGSCLWWHSLLWWEIFWALSCP